IDRLSRRNLHIFLPDFRKSLERESDGIAPGYKPRKTVGTSVTGKRGLGSGTFRLTSDRYTGKRFTIRSEHLAVNRAGVEGSLRKYLTGEKYKCQHQACECEFLHELLLKFNECW